MARTVLLDTGFLVALANRRDPDHRRCLVAWKELRAKFVSVEGVLVEAAHLLRRAPSGAEVAFNIAAAVATEFLAPTRERYQCALALMSRYRSAPMDFVDALLVAAAEELSIAEILTLDRRGFETYRAGQRPFVILPTHAG